MMQDLWAHPGVNPNMNEYAHAIIIVELIIVTCQWDLQGALSKFFVSLLQGDPGVQHVWSQFGPH